MPKSLLRVLSLCLALILLLGAVPFDGMAAEVTEPPTEVTEPTATDPPATEPEPTDPPQTEPPVTEAPSTEPEVTAPVETEPAVTEPEVTEPVETEPTEPSGRLPYELDEEGRPFEVFPDTPEDPPFSEETPNTAPLKTRAASTRGDVIKHGIVWASYNDKIFSITTPDSAYGTYDRLYVYAVNDGDSYTPGYCIAPWVPPEEAGNYTQNQVTVQDAWTYRSENERRAIGLALLYGYPHAPSGDTRLEKRNGHAATQLVITEIALGFRSPVYPYELLDTRLIDLFAPDGEGVWSTDGTTGASNGYLTSMHAKYNALIEAMRNHSKIPSFCTTDAGFAQSYEMTNNGNGTFSVTMTDTNNILSSCTFTNTDKLKFSVSGNKLTVTTSSPESLTTVRASKNVPNIDAQSFLVWTYPNKQPIAQAMEPTPDPMPLYFKLKVSASSLEITKTTEDGQNLSGWQFSIYSDQACTTLISGPHTTDSNGKIKADNLTPGTVWVKELGHSDAAINNKYYCDSANPQQVTLTAGGTAKVSFTNKLNMGVCKIVKATTNGGSKAGWHFTVKNSGGTVIGNYTTDSSGVISLSVLPGVYTVTETDGAYTYWVNDPNPTRTVTVKANETATVTFTNQWRGRAQIIKTATNGGSVSGWHFTVKDSAGKTVGSYVTDSSGVITLDLEPGTFTVTETDAVKEYWHNDPSATKTVTVKAGSTAKVSFQNEWKGKAKIIKTATNGGSVQGWHFKVQDSNGKLVGEYTTDSNGIIVLDIDPGTFTVTETDAVKDYWHNDPTPSKTVTVKAGQTAEVSFKNEWVGRAKVVKTLDNPEAGTVEGWEFDIHKILDNGSTQFLETANTDAEGIILRDMEPGRYRITEKLPEDSLWQCTTPISQDITVKAGETAEVKFTNALRPGKIAGHKVNVQGESLPGVTFCLEWSEDGKNWKPVSYTDSPVPQIGGCTSAGVKDGKLTTGADGMVVYEGLYPTLQYRLTEVSTLDGYQLLTEPAYLDGLSVENDLLVELTVVNVRTYVLPETGSKELLFVSSPLWIVAAFEAYWFLKQKRRQK